LIQLSSLETVNNMKSGEYKDKGEYHKYLSKEWSYYPLYVSKKKFVVNYLSKFQRDISVLDIGCGEGVFVEELKKNGFSLVIGIDENYSSDLVLRGSVLSLPFSDRQFDVILILDEIEHISIEKQEIAVKEIFRVLKPDGILIASIPNLAHLASRIRFLLKGKLMRTASVKKHPGDRPIKEFLEIFRKNSFLLQKRKGFFPTVPVAYKLVQKYPSRYLWLYHLLNFLVPCSDMCFLNLIVYKKGEGKRL
jgi:2-polyprenyl-3-methyl-5-hydroxy-6-metoxy-1,4-benzoquinol methylase